MQIIRASDIANYIYCQRVFWYSVKGIEPDNDENIQYGIFHHSRLERQIYFSRIVKKIAIGMAAVGILLFILELLI